MIRFVCRCAVLHEHSFLEIKYSPRSSVFCVCVCGGGGVKPTVLLGAFQCGGLGMPSRWEWGLASYNIKTMAVDHTILGSVLGEFHAHTTLNTSFVDF